MNKKPKANKPKENSHKKNEGKNQKREDYAGLLSKRLMRVYKNPDQHLNAQLISQQLKSLTPEIQAIYLGLQAKAACECHYFSPSESRLEVNLRHYHSVFFKPSPNSQAQTTQQKPTTHSQAASTQTKNNTQDILKLLKYAHAQERSFFYKVYQFFGVSDVLIFKRHIRAVHQIVAEFLAQGNAAPSFTQFLQDNLHLFGSRKHTIIAFDPDLDCVLRKIIGIDYKTHKKSPSSPPDSKSLSTSSEKSTGKPAADAYNKGSSSSSVKSKEESDHQQRPSKKSAYLSKHVSDSKVTDDNEISGSNISGSLPRKS